MIKFGDMKRLELRRIWPDEAHDFTPWLADNIEQLGEALGFEIELSETEAGVGDFSLDLLAKDLSTGHNVIIENQLTVTDHEHLGKLLTYAAGFEASRVIWIAEAIREEHRQALDWLNQRTDSDTQFFGVVVEVLQIDDSNPALNFKPVVFPNEWQKSKRRTRTRTVSTRGEAYREFFQHLIDELREEHKFTGARVGQPHNWYSFASGYSGITYGFSFAMGAQARAELYIDHGDADENKRLFDWLAEDRESIEAEFGEAFKWERMDDKRSSRIAVYRSGSIDDDEDTLSEIRAWSIEQLLVLKRVFSPRLERYKRESRQR